MGELVTIIGGVTVAFGALDLFSFGNGKYNNDLKKPVIRIVGGLVVVGIGVLMKNFGV